MMNCHLIQNRISPYLDGELDGNEMLRVRHHLDDCHTCANELECCRRLKEMVAALPEIQPAPGFEQRLMRLVLQSETRTAKEAAPNFFSLRGAFAFGAASVAAFSVFHFGFIVQAEESATQAVPAYDILVHDQEYEQARGLFPANTIPAGIESVQGRR